jgi:hypothetical protein
VDAVEEAIIFSQTQGRNIQIISGIELSTRWHGFDIHVLGLNVDHKNAEFLERLTQQHSYRIERAKSIDGKLQKAGVEGVLEKAQLLAGVGQVTRAHFARAMIELGIVNSMDQAFKKYLGKGQRAFVTPQWISIEEAITWIHDAGGQAVLAHPAHYDLSAKWLRRLIAQFKVCGGDGMEVTHPQLHPEKKRFLRDLALEHKLMASVGSDFHGPGRWTELGRNLQIDESLTPIWHDWSWYSEGVQV